MATDLTNIYDHPAEVLLQKANVTRMVSETAAKALRAYEKENGVTFAALSNEGLAAVRETYAEVMAAGNAFDGAQAGQDLSDAVRDLLGLGD